MIGTERTAEHGGRALLLAATLVCAAAPWPVAAQETVRLEGRRVQVYNLAGRMEVVRGTGPEVVVEVTRRGADGARLELVRGPGEGGDALRVRYPADRIVYPGMGRRSRTTVQVGADGTFGRSGRGERVTLAGSGEGLEAWADLRIVVPPGRTVETHLAVGDVAASGLEADLFLNTGAGDIEVRGQRGALRIDTGSGDVTVQGAEGEVEVDTGSGSVRLEDVRGARVSVDTGSGDVDGAGVGAPAVRVDTGSGSIRLGGVSAADVVLDTGSGSVDLHLLGDVERLEVDTGSGSVTVRLPDGVGAEVEVETGSGGIEVDFPLDGSVRRRNALEGRIGDGRGRIHIDTGSGSVRLSR